MIGDSQIQEALELQLMTNNSMQDDGESYTEETAVVDNGLQQKFLERSRRQQLLHKPFRHSIHYITKSRRFWTVVLLVLTVSTSIVMLISHQAQHKVPKIVVKNKGTPIPKVTKITKVTTRKITTTELTTKKIETTEIDTTPIKLADYESDSSTITDSSSSSSGDEVTEDIGLISEYWGNLRPYSHNPDNYFGVNNTGLPYGCQVEQSFILHRHGARFPGTTDYNDFRNLAKRFQNTTGTYTGPLTFLNTWTYLLGAELLLPEGAYMELQSGLDFWDRYGRTLYNAAKGQNYYNGTGQSKPLLRCNTISRITDSAVSWANGFFALYNTTNQYSLLAQKVGPGFNTTLASFFSCTNFGNRTNGVFDFIERIYEPVGNYLQDAVTRLKQYIPSDVNFTVNDAFILQSLCTYEYFIFDSSGFCSLFTLNEWKGFSYTVDLFIYNGFSFGTPFGRALGLGVLEELIARLKNQTITVSDSSVNTTLDNNTNTFPLGQKFYLDMTHDFMIIGLLTAMSLDYFRSPLSYDNYPPPEDRNFKTTHIVPYGARFITEKIGCSSSNPTEVSTAYTQYTPTQYGYSANNASYKFIRMRLNSGILPISTIRGGFCSGRTDGLCPLRKFLASQANASTQASYAKMCFGNFVYNSSRFSDDGNYFY